MTELHADTYALTGWRIPAAFALMFAASITPRILIALIDRRNCRFANITGTD